LVATAFFLVLFSMCYSLAWKPLSTGIEYYQSQIPAQRELVFWLAKASRRVQGFKNSSMTARGVMGGGSPLSSINQSAREMHLGKSISQVTPVSNNGIRVKLGDVVFDDMVAWLVLLKSRYALTVTDLSVEHSKGPGIVRADITFAGGQ